MKALGHLGRHRRRGKDKAVARMTVVWREEATTLDVGDCKLNGKKNKGRDESQFVVTQKKEAIPFCPSSDSAHLIDRGVAFDP